MSAQPNAAFKYTLDAPCAGVLTTAQRAFYEENGYLVIPKLVHPDLLEKYRERFVALCNGEIETRKLLSTICSVHVFTPPFLIPAAQYMTIMRDVATTERVRGEHTVTKVDRPHGISHG